MDESFAPTVLLPSSNTVVGGIGAHHARAVGISSEPKAGKRSLLEGRAGFDLGDEVFDL